MDKDKCIVPSVVSLHVRNIDEKEPLKNLFNCSDAGNNRRLSYNLVRIYNTSYNSNRNKPVSENLPPYLANLTSNSHSLHSEFIDCRFNALIKRGNPEYPSLFPNNRPQLVSQFWSNSMRNHQTEECIVSKKCPSPSSDTDSQRINVNSKPSTNSILKQNTLLKKKSTVCVRLEQLDEDALYLPTNSAKNKSKTVESLEKSQSTTSAVEEPLVDSDTNLIKTSNKKYQNFLDKPPTKKQTSSILLPMKERATTASIESASTSQSRSQTSLYKTHTNTVHKPSTPALAISDSDKTADTTNKRNNSPLLARLINTQSNFMSNTQSFPYPNPCDSDGSATILSRLNELSALESETVRWERTKTVKRRTKVQMDSM